MRTIRTKVYLFNELSKEAQEKAIEDYRTVNYENIDLSDWQERAIDLIKEKGFEGIALGYSLGYSQGNGVCFNAESIDYSVLVSFFREILGDKKDKTIDFLINNCSFRLVGYKNRGSFASKSDLDYYLDDGFKNDISNCEEIIAKVLDKLENYYVDLCRDLQKSGYEEIEYLNSDSYIKESILTNEYEFLSNGKMY